MKKFFTLGAACALAGCCAFAQVKNAYLYNTNMPYGTLDLRTQISSSNYYYLQENKTFSFRESSPGVRTNTYLDMTAWESNPYMQGNLRHRNGTKDDFVMNYRLLMPAGYKSTYAKGYPLMVHFHGAAERANCLYNNCYHGGWDYTPQENSPPAPASPTHRLLNNDHNLNVGGKQYLAARNLAGTLLPDDPAMPKRAFPGFVLSAQMMNSWDSLQVQDVVRIVRLLAAKYRIDQDRIYVQGLSIGGYAVYEAMKRAPWLFAAALPMAAVWDANIQKQNRQAKVAHIPVWTFQGGLDKRPTPAYTESVISYLQKAGAVVRYTYYADLGHSVWNKAYALGDYFTWILKQSKANLHARGGNLVIDRAKGQYPVLMLAEGFFAYQWEKNGVLLTATSPTYKATAPGTYRARFSRKASPTASQWNRWSDPVKVVDVSQSTATASSARAATSEEEVMPEPEVYPEAGVVFDVYPNPAPADNLTLRLTGLADAPVQVRIVDQLGRELYAHTFGSPALARGQQLALPAGSKGGVYILMVNQGMRQMRKKVVLRE